ncbi:hypothetical protein D7V80_11850 [Corallococcus sp. CA054B]|uniref:hypothetical protein n=1 Tax=Corallococcus sp. CA054B TaxID=2316734 RepID=UPI000EDD8343|nr:hypothetical protein [Corallococcus sp. CA054B]RKG68683.1 hypothetical protein D7V80_11850 [Corallococcus sp. CA054B]
MGPGEPRANEGRQTGRVGQYHLGRCIERRTEQGDVYLARHVQTGQPAIVVRPEVEESQLVQTTPEEVLEQFPSASLEVTWTSSDSPAFRALQVRLPHAAATAKVHEELVAVSEDLPKLLDRAMGAPELREHLLAPPLTRRQRWRGLVRRHANRGKTLVVQHWKDAALGLLVTAFLGNLILPQRQHEPSSEPPRTVVAEQHEPESVVLTNGVGQTAMEEIEAPVLLVSEVSPFIARDMPSRPFKVQRRPPCRGSQKEINGGCWVQVVVADAPPCPDDLYEHKGGCYAPVKAEPEDGTSRSISK